MRKLLIIPALFVLAGACTPAKNTAVGAGRMTKSGAEAVADTTEKAAEKTAQKTTDVSISMAVKGKLADDELVRASHIDVDTHDGIVYLQGHQDSEAASSRAEQLARQTDGVRAVVNQIVVSR
jgi:osmotically-inducible protein OsmY